MGKAAEWMASWIHPDPRLLKVQRSLAKVQASIVPMTETECREKVAMLLDTDSVARSKIKLATVFKWPSDPSAPFTVEVTSFDPCKKTEAVCSTLMFLLVSRIRTSGISKISQKRILESPVSLKLSRMKPTDCSLNSHNFYPETLEQVDIYQHLSSGGNTSAFRGSTQSASSHLEEYYTDPRCYYYPITEDSLNCGALKECYDGLTLDQRIEFLRELHLEAFPFVFSQEGEVTLARPIPLNNVKMMHFPFKKGTSVECHVWNNPDFDSNQVTRHELTSWETQLRLLNSMGVLCPSLGGSI